MTLSVQKNFPLPPAIVIEIPGVSPSGSGYESNEDIQACQIRTANEDVEGQWSSGASSPFVQQSHLLGPTFQFNDFHTQVSGGCSSRNSLLIPYVLPQELLAQRLPQDVLQPHTVKSSGEYLPTTHYLRVPKKCRPLRHSQSLRSDPKCKEAYDRDSRFAICPPRRNEHSIFSIANFRPRVNSASSKPCSQLSHGVLSNSSIVPTSIFQNQVRNREACRPNSHLNVNGSGKVEQLRSSSLTPTFSSSGASSSQISSNYLPGLPSPSTRSTHGSYFQIRTPDGEKTTCRLRRSYSLVESGAFRRILEGPQTAVQTFGERSRRNRSAARRPSRRSSARHRSSRVQNQVGETSKSHQESWVCYPSSRNLNPKLSHRRHTDGSEIKMTYLSPSISSRRTMSVCSQVAGDKFPFLIQNSDGSRKMASCLNCFPQATSYSGTPTFPDQLVDNSQSDKTNPTNEANLGRDSITERMTSQPPMETSSSGGLCFCQLIVLLVCMQIAAGTAVVILGLYLRWKVPLLPTEECAFWAAVPILLTGTIGALICQKKSKPIFSAHVNAVLWRIAEVLSLASCILCLVASIFSGQKGSLIASYGTSCVTAKAQNNPTVSTSRRANQTEVQNYPLGFERQCCSDEFSRENQVTCRCYNTRSQLMWSYKKISCRYLFSSVKDYLILQSALMAVGSGVCLWLWVVLTEQRAKRTSEPLTQKTNRSSAKSSVVETTTSGDAKWLSIGASEPTRPASQQTTICDQGSCLSDPVYATVSADPSCLRTRHSLESAMQRYNHINGNPQRRVKLRRYCTFQASDCHGVLMEPLLFDTDSPVINTVSSVNYNHGCGGCTVPITMSTN